MMGVHARLFAVEMRLLPHPAPEACENGDCTTLSTGSIMAAVSNAMVNLRFKPHGFRTGSFYWSMTA